MFFGDVMSFTRAFLLATFVVLSIGRASAQVDGAATQIVIPVVSSSVSFVSQMVVRDQSGTSRSVTMQFFEAQTSSTPGTKACTPVTLGPFETKTVTLTGQCPLAAGNHHGFVILTDASTNRDKLFYAFTRIENPASIGFTVEGYPIGHLGGGDTYSEVPGVKRRAAAGGAPALQTNCFAATLNDPVSYTISLDIAGSTPISDSLGAFQMKRYSDIYTLAGLPAGDFNNTTVTFSKDDPSQFPNTLLTFCTVQDNTSFAADFRIGKNWNAADPSRFRLNCFGANFGANPGECDNTLPASAPTVPTGTKARLLTRLYAPDTVNCSVLGSRAADLEMRLRTDDTPQVTVAGGDNVNSFKYTTGPRSDIGFGYSQYFWIEVGLREGGNTAPAQFGVRCMTGNGMMDPRFIDTPADDF
jgi:FlaG/FlaF family flagellin (archaellin)